MQPKDFQLGICISWPISLPTDEIGYILTHLGVFLADTSSVVLERGGAVSRAFFGAF